MQATVHDAYNRQFIAGAWRTGRSATVIENLDPTAAGSSLRCGAPR